MHKLQDFCSFSDRQSGGKTPLVFINFPRHNNLYSITTLQNIQYFGFCWNCHLWNSHMPWETSIKPNFTVLLSVQFFGAINSSLQIAWFSSHQFSSPNFLNIQYLIFFFWNPHNYSCFTHKYININNIRPICNEFNIFIFIKYF